jgi:hypothetical protein
MKGQTQQVFIYIMVILIVGAVLLFGFKSINDIIKKACEVEEVTFKMQLKDLIEKNTDYGTISQKTINSPCGYEKLCIIDSSVIIHPETYVDNNGPGPIATINPNNQLIVNEVAAGTGNNVFLLKGDEITPLYSLDMIVINDNQGYNYTCLTAKGGEFYLNLEGIGNGMVQISEGS